MPKVLTTKEYQDIEQKFNDKLEMTLVKTRNYNLKPYGKFVLKWKIAKGKETPNQILIEELTVYHSESMPLTPEQDKDIVKYMKKHKTDILVDSYGYYYTRYGNNLARVTHLKLNQYNTNEGFRELVDDGHSFGRKE